MSELKDIHRSLEAWGAVLRAIAVRVAEQDESAKQLRENVHALNNRLAPLVLQSDEANRFIGKLSDTLDRMEGQLESLREDVLQGFRKDRADIRELQEHEEKTQP